MSNHGLSSTLLFLILFLPGLALWHRSSKVYGVLVSGFRWSMLGLGVCILWMTPRLIYMFVQRQPRDITAFQHELPPGSIQEQPRVVWILLDELSFDQTFDHRQPGLNLPNFDALRGQSTSFSNILPAGYFTDKIIPAVLRGKAVVDERSGSDGSLFVRSSPDSGWERYDPQATVFGDAHRLGWTTGIAGWFNPYCRIFASVADQCAWLPESYTFHGHMSSRKTVLENALAPLRIKSGASAENVESSEHQAAYSALMDLSRALVNNGSIRFVYLHLPVPHPPGVYDRTRRQMRNGGSYLDNLALADEALGELRAAIEATGEARNTTLMVSSDHSMRVPKWRGGLSWTSEDERVFHARFDMRPVLLIHFAGDGTAHAVDSLFDELRTHDLLEEILQGRMKNAGELNRWLTAGNRPH
jgi:hypothetical protein